MDLNSGVPVFSDKELDREIFEFLQKHLEKAWKDASAHSSKIGEINPVRVKLEDYQKDSDLFDFCQPGISTKAAPGFDVVRRRTGG